MTSSAPAPPPAPAPAAAPTAPDAVTPTFRRAMRRAAPWLVGFVVLLIVAIVWTFGVGGARDQNPLGADNPGPAGARGLVEVLRSQGVTVTTAGSLAEAKRAAGPDATVLLYDSGYFLDGDQLADLATAGSPLVVVEPSTDALDILAPDVAFAGLPGDTAPLEAGCDLPAATRAGTLSPGDSSFAPISGDDATGSTVYCFPDSGGGYQLAQSTASGTSVTLLADGTPLDNEHILAAGNAALALNLLGSTNELVWYLPTFADLPLGESAPSTAELTPEWVTPVLVLLLAVFVAAAVWRGRRFGPLVVENLPVTVRASETMEGRARLYARAGARLRALDALRIGTIGRLAGVLSLSRSATVEEIVAAVAASTGRHSADVRRLLLDAPPQNDRELVTLSDELLDLERDVRSATDPR